ncbi:hypothetical protein BPAE_0112g00330 [Botrytis paeoniae]|uniref:Uncharacterized protein n=1 Tax=Botrytis paeoniae TaxID=278948 RepID=A0A4Z1FH08_9HELO|nr:hypothetical protein BPAE_0112g00330 [Botrytis paeoniae]
MSASTTTSTVSSASAISSFSVPVVSSSSTTISSISSMPIIYSSSITAISSSTPLASFPPSSTPIIPISSIPTPSSSPSPSRSPSQTSISSPSTSPTPPFRHTASQTLSPSHISAEPSSLLQIATPIVIPPSTGTSISLLTQLQEALDFTSTLLGLFFVSILTLLFIYWSTLYILRKTVGITPRDTSPIAQLKKKNKNNTPTSPKSPSHLQTTTPLPPKKEPWPTDGIQLAGLGSVSDSEKAKAEQIAQATDAEELGEASERKKEDVLAEADLEFQRGVRDVRGDTDAIERRGGRSYGAL